MAKVLALVEPVMLVLMAVMVAGMLLAFYLPLFEAISGRAERRALATRPEDRRTPAAPPPTRAEEEAARALAARYGLEYVDVALLRARPRDPAVGARRADVPLQLPALPAGGAAGWCW